MGEYRIRTGKCSREPATPLGTFGATALTWLTTTEPLLWSPGSTCLTR